MNSLINVTFLMLLVCFPFTVWSSQMSIRYNDGHVQTVPLDRVPSHISQITIGGGGGDAINSGTIRVISGTYGQNCGTGHGNKTDHLASQCNGKSFCDYRIDHTVIGDPAFGCSKEYIAEWRCGSGDLKSTKAKAEAGFGSVIRLSCP